MKTAQMVDLPLDAFSQYARVVRKTSPLAKDEEAFLLRLLAKEPHNEHALTTISAAYQPMILSLAGKYQGRCQSLELMDLVQEGNAGLLLALNSIASFDASADASFSTWLYACIRNAMQNAIWTTDRGMVIPRHLLRLLGHFQVAKDIVQEKLRKEAEAFPDVSHSLEPSPLHIAKEMGVSIGQVIELADLAQRKVMSLEAARVGPDGRTVAEGLAAPVEASQEDYRIWFTETLPHLPESEQIVLSLRYGLHDGVVYTYIQIARQLQMTPERVTTLEHRAKDRLRRLYVATQRAAARQPTAS